MADGPNHNEVLRNFTQIIEGFIETAMKLGWNIPEPRGR